MQEKEKDTSKVTYCFIVFALLWEIAVGIIYGLFIGYNETVFQSMEGVQSTYPFSETSSQSSSYLVSSSQFPYPVAVVAIAIILLIVGLSMVAAYIERSTVTGMAFTLLIFALTVQNFFIFRNFWQNISLNNPNNNVVFSGSFTLINYINFGNGLQSSYAFTSASFLDAVGASLAMYAGYTAVIGRIGLTEIFFLTWIGTFIYEINSQILWRLYIPDNGYPSRAFAYGGMLGLIASLVLNKRDKTLNNNNFRSSYKIMALAFLGTIFVWCSYPILVLSSVYDSQNGEIVAMAGQVNIWLALAASVLGCYTASSFAYRKFCVHDMVFASFTGAIAFSSSTDINYNPGAATAIGYSVGFLCSFMQTRLKKKINENGVIDSNSAIFQFLIPSLFAAIFSAIVQSVQQTSATFTNIDTATTITYAALKEPGRSFKEQGGYQMAGWAISIGIGAVAGLIIGLVFKLTNGTFERADSFFNDNTLYAYPKVIGDDEQAPAPVYHPGNDKPA